jgi:hypothetical protein
MKKLRLNKNGELTAKDISYFGGQYSFWEKVSKIGVGSSKVLYESGIDHFDQMKRAIEGEIGFVSFELLKNGLILRLNINQRFSCIGMKLDDIKEINLIGYRIEVYHRQFGKVIIKIVHRGELEIIGGEHSIKFSMVTREFDSFVDYFLREELAEKFHLSISLDPPEKDDAYELAEIGSTL